VSAALSEIQVQELDAYLQKHLDGYRGRPEIRQLPGGQSNPTFVIETGARRFVLRKKPSGSLLPTAHQIEREYRVCRALETTDVPVPRTHLLCEDPSIIGTPFFVMDYVPGRVFRDVCLPDLSPPERRAVYEDMARVLAALHGVDYREKGLEDYGRPGDYVGRQIRRWTQQYRAAETSRIEPMDRLIEWLPASAPGDDASALVHGDYQLYNLLVHPSEPRVVAVVDWELSTLGHPLSDLAYNCMKYHREDEGPLGEGIPGEQEFVELYCTCAHRDPPRRWHFYLALSFFRYASILQGVYKRYLQGNASSPDAHTRGPLAVQMATIGWRLAQQDHGA
jgi:aminoglycoside phosphotransferase (APT) family kinase protein